MFVDFLNPFAGSICLALSHSLWQSFLVICLLKLVLKLIPETVPEYRYQIVVAAWLLVNASLPLNLVYQWNQPEPFAFPIWGSIIFFASWGLLTGIQLFQFLKSQRQVAKLLKRPGLDLSSQDQRKSDELKDLLNKVGAENKVKRKVPLKIIEDIDGHNFIAATAGITKPTIFVSTQALRGIRLEIFSSIFAHEISHIIRRDYLEEILLRTCEVFLFFNPAIYYIHKRLRHERERLCDRMTINGFCDPIDYAKSLEAVGKFILGQQKLGGTVPYSPGDPGTVKHNLKRRISALLARRRRR